MLEAAARMDEEVRKLSSPPLVCREDERVEAVEGLLKKYRRIPVVDRQGKIQGILTATDFLRAKRKKMKRGKQLSGTAKGIMTREVIGIKPTATLKEALEVFKNAGRGGYPLIEKQKPVGILTEFDLIKHLKGYTGISVSQVMTPRVLVLNSKWPINAALDAIALGAFRRLPVVEKGILVGILAPRDLLEKEGETVDEIMTSRLVTIEPDADLGEAIELMKRKRRGALPVVRHDRLEGIITERDVVEAMV